ncbi:MULTISPECIES: SAR2788 family putative toxin [Bacillus cereus group]|uniref:Uncharacterized protein n=1 Tax=Bacillus cereus TaxID=1396 RepID=A0AAN5XL38_BACCE|nr:MULTISPECIES: SAR2788 family putative toxin [Bacillus cereus group]KAB2447482.1 hypothetical protein F8165_24620 [Bacillus cereus]KAB2485484.1 hypothetical protein F8157_15785 [Bacillus cereus]KMP50354.1 hypothetical protein TU59_20695 [Bacillus cereus]MCS6596058.1 SAR2788 family putative toxin [Bacillus cereus]MDA2411359.1 SAR2788 family putative toxin [Bacillus cereus]
MFKKIVSLMLIFVLSIGILPNGKAIAEELIQDENIEVLENNSEKVEVQTEVETVEGDAIVSAAWDKSDNAFTVKSMETDANGNEVEKEYRVDVEEATEDVFKATFTDVKTNESFEVDSTEARASVAFLLPIAGVIGQGLVSHLIAIGAAVVIAGATYTAVGKVAAQLRKKNHNHYAAVLTKGDLYIGGPISKATAVSRLKSSDKKNNNVWSKTYALAATVAKDAGNGRTPIGPERDKGKTSAEGYYFHFHIHNRTGGHSFY